MRSAVVPGCVLLVLALELGGGHTSPVREKFVVHASSLSPHEGQTLTLTCYIDGPAQASIDAPSAYEWVKDGKVIPGETGKTLTFGKLSSQDEGDYKCGPPNPDTPREVFHLRVIRRQTSPLHETIFYVDKTGSSLKGRTTTLHCYFFGPLEITPSSYVWVKDGEVIPGETGNTFTLENLSIQNTGNYQCGDPDIDFPRRNYHLQVITMLPTPEIFKDRVPVCELPFSLNCIIMDGYTINDNMVYTWYKGSTEIKGQSDQVLRFDKVTDADAGEYTCTARDGPIDTTSPHSPAFDVTPLVKPEVFIHPTNPNSLVNGILGETLTLTCKVNRAVPRVPFNGYSWSFLPNHKEEPLHLVGTSRTLTLGPLTKADGGQYFCQARNDQDYETVTLVGEGSVVVDIVYLDNISLMADANINESDRMITCKVESHPIAHLVWIVGGEEVRHVIDNLDHYVIPKTACMASRNYTCRATNSDLPGREITATTQLRVPCKQELKKGADRRGAIHADVSAPFDFSLPEQTSVVVVHPSGQDVITVYRNCSYIVSLAFRSRCLHPQCDPDSHHVTFVLTHVTDKDEGFYFCVDEKLRKPIPDCYQTLVLERQQIADAPLLETNVKWIIGVLAAILLVVITVLLLIKFQHVISKIVLFILSSVWFKSNPSLSPETEKKVNSFDSLYDKGKVYIFPQLVQPKEGTTPEAEELESESAPLLATQMNEYEIKNLIRYALQMTTLKESLPSFILHNICLGMQKKIILILSRQLGIIVLMVEPTTDGWSLTVEKAVHCLSEAKVAVKDTLKGLVKLDSITAVIALPNLSRNDSTCSNKQSADVVELKGQEKDDFQQWAEQLGKRGDSKVWDLSTVDSADTAFKMAASKFLTLGGSSHPGDSPEGRTEAESWLLTPDQMKVRDSTARLLHIWGPLGEGKKTLLIHRAERWLAEGKAVILAVGKEMYDILLARITEAMLKEQGEGRAVMIRVCCEYKALNVALKELKGLYPNLKICVITDILHHPRMFQNVLQRVKKDEISGVWSACITNLHIIDEKLSLEARKLDWESIHLPSRISRPNSTVHLIKLLRRSSSADSSAMDSNVPSTENKPEWKVVDHCLHQDTTPTTSSCVQCEEELATVMRSSDQDRWRKWVALHTGEPDVFNDVQGLQTTLLGLRVPLSTGSYGKDLAEMRGNIVDGVDEKEHDAIPLRRIGDFNDLEVMGILLVHRDDRDKDGKCQSPNERKARRNHHRQQWTKAASRCKGQVILLLLTPSPARSLLNLPDPVMP